ncbi:toprim domain-containing protein [Aureispira sp. CCB-QB1]|uniref:toprim domain-containing protein n=1 Tax=Aureispira sp. CCB-QB1 TaxID=1313421 RepID=UPI000698CF7C|nr:toprim domain-containing protein [Aureispira sp. CCB-QB1]
MTIEEIKSRLSIQDVLAHYGIEPNKNKHINCPFHEDKTPSMKVYAETNTVYCFSGNCATHGSSLDVIEFVMKKEGCTKHQAILKCKALLGHIEPIKAELRTMDEVWKSLQQSLSRSEKAKSYLKNRGLSTKGVGYHSGQLHKGKLAQEARAVGLINDQNKPWAANCVLYPLKDALDKVVSLYGRSLTTGHFYLSGRCGLYPCYPSKKAKQIILTESIIDAASLLEIKALRDYTILSLYGTNGFTGEHKKALESCGDLEEIILLLDGDEAGQKASKKYQTELQQLLPKVNTRIVELPNNTDVNELWANHLSEALFVELLKEEKAVVPIFLLDCSDPNNLKYERKNVAYYVKGFKENMSLDSLQVRLICSNREGVKYRGKVELYEDTAVQKYCLLAAKKLKVEVQDLDLDIGILTDELEAYREGLKSGQKQPKKIHKIALSSKEKAAALDFLKRENLFKRLNKRIGETGIVGEENTRLLLLIVASSYKNSNPLHALIQGSTGSGKTLLLRKIMHLIPEQDRHIWTRITDKSLYHAGHQYAHKSIAIEDWDGLSEEVQYIVREFQSGHILRSSTTEKQADGSMSSKEIIAYGPISSMMCTTQGAIYEDNMSRCFLVAVDESEEQTKYILDYQYQKDRGELNKKEEEKAMVFIQHLVDLLEAKEVLNPFAGKVQLPAKVHKIRRLNHLFQSFVRQITWWHQHQRKQNEQGQIIAQKEDVQAAITLLFETIVLKIDELDGSLRSFYERLKRYVLEQEGGKNYHFNRREVRQMMHKSKSQIERYIRQLQELEYIRQVGGYANKGYAYEIVYWDDNKGLRKEIQSYMNDQLSQL